MFFFSGNRSFSTGVFAGCTSRSGGDNGNCSTNLTNIEEITTDSGAIMFTDTSGVTRVSGSGFNGILSNGTFPISTSPVDISSQISGIPTKIIAGSGRYFAVQSDGVVKVWGNNGDNELGTSISSRSVNPLSPESIVQANNWSDVISNTLALNTNGDVFVWGFNQYGKSGDGNATDGYILSPQQVPGLSNITNIYGNNVSHFAKDQNGNVYVWGRNNNNDLGLGFATPDPGVTTPTLNPSLQDYKYISDSSTCGINSNDDLYCWGNNSSGQLGTGGTADEPSPVLIDNNVVDVGGSTVYAKSDGTVWVTGFASSGCLGNGTISPNISVPTQITGLTNIVDIDVCSALDSSGNVYRWGLGPVGDGTEEDRLTPVQISTPEPITSLTFQFMVGQSGNLYTYTTPESLSPVQIENISNVQNLNNNYFQADITNPITTADIPALSLSCQPAIAETTTTCTFTQPTDTFTPVDFKLSVGNATPAGSCSES